MCKEIPIALIGWALSDLWTNQKLKQVSEKNQVAGNLNRNSVEVCSTPVVFTMKKLMFQKKHLFQL